MTNLLTRLISDGISAQREFISNPLTSVSFYYICSKNNYHKSRTEKHSELYKTNTAGPTTTCSF